MSLYHLASQCTMFDEDDGEIQVVLVLSNPSSVDIIVQVVDNSSTAMGTFTIFLSKYQWSYRRR